MVKPARSLGRHALRGSPGGTEVEGGDPGQQLHSRVPQQGPGELKVEGGGAAPQLDGNR